MPYGLPDPSEAVRRILTRAEQGVLDDALALAARVPGAAARMVAGNLHRKALDTLSMLSKVPPRMADDLLKVYKGVAGRPMTTNEIAAVAEAFPNKAVTILTGLVRIVAGPGLSVIARQAFSHGNPAITLGSSIYIKRDVSQVNLDDLTLTEFGRAMIVHEFTHVVQYTMLGVPAFAAHYAADLARVKGDDDQLYRFWLRSSPFLLETLEGQAEMVGQFKGKSASSKPEDQNRAAEIRRKLKGTGIYGY